MSNSPTSADDGFLGEQDDIHEEFHSIPVPLAQRLGFREPALVWSGFGIAFICAVIGGQIQQGLILAKSSSSLAGGAWSADRKT